MMLKSNNCKSKDGFWVGKWRYAMPRRRNERIDVVVRLCFGPLKTEKLGYKDGAFFRETHHIEDEPEEYTEFEQITPEEFFKELKQEIILSVSNNCPILTEALEQLRDELLALQSE